MGTKCFAPVRGQVARFTLLDHKGAPLEGDRSVVVTSGIIKATVTEVVETASAEMVRNDVEATRLYIPVKNTTMGYGVDIDLCGVDPDLLSILTGQPVVLNALGDVSGNSYLTKQPVSNFAMEIWSKLANPVDGYKYGYTVFPRLRGGRMSGFEIGGNGMNLTVGSSKTYRMSRWGFGPHTLRWAGSGWDMVGWDTTAWDSFPGRCLDGVAIIPGTSGPFGEEPFGVGPFGGGMPPIDPIYPRLGERVGAHTHWQVFLLDAAPAPVCGAQPLYDSIDGGSAGATSVGVLDGEFVYTSDDGVDGGQA